MLSRLRDLKEVASWRFLIEFLLSKRCFITNAPWTPGLWIFIRKQTPSNLMTLPKIKLAIIWFNNLLFTWLDVSMATGFWQPIFPNFNRFYLFMTNFKFTLVTLTFLHDFDSYLLVFINFKTIWMIFCGFGDVEKSKMADVKNEWHECHVIWRHRPTLQTSKNSLGHTRTYFTFLCYSLNRQMKSPTG